VWVCVCIEGVGVEWGIFPRVYNTV